MKILKILLLCALFIPLSGCLDTMTEQDHVFVAKIKESLKQKGDIVRVSDIHPGDWKKVCFTVAGASYDAIQATVESEGANYNKLVVINRGKHEARHGDMFEWGIYFFYPPNRIEYFNIFNGDMYPWQQKSITDEYGCVSKEGAYFKARDDLKKNDYRNNFLAIQLTDFQKGK